MGQQFITPSEILPGTLAYTNQYLLTGTTTNATETELFATGNTRISITSGKTSFYTVDIIGKRTDVVGDYGAFRLQGVSNNTANTYADLGNILEMVIYRTNSSYLCDARVDNTNKSLSVYVTGVSGHTISWQAVITTVEV